MTRVCCYHGKLASFPVATCRLLTSLAAKRAKLLVAILLPLETRKVTRGNTVTSSPKFRRALLNLTIKLLAWFFSGFNLRTAQVVWITAMKNHGFRSFSAVYVLTYTQLYTSVVIFVVRYEWFKSLNLLHWIRIIKKSRLEISYLKGNEIFRFNQLESSD